MLDTHLADFFVLLGLFLGGVLSPGPDMAIIISNALVHGRRIGVLIGLGLATGILIHSTYTILGFGVLFKSFHLLQEIVKYLGSMYLCYMGVMFLRQSAKKKDLTHSESKSLTTFKAYQMGVLTNVLNPFAALFMMSLLLTRLPASISLTLQFTYVLGLGLVYFIWNVITAYLLTQRVFRQQFLKVSEWISRLAGLALIFYGIKFFLAELPN